MIDAARRIDLNADMGEGKGDDLALLEIVTSANIACGGHAGDRDTMNATVAAAVARGVAVGAHPSYPDRENFGRKSMALEPDEMERRLGAQLEAIARIARSHGTQLSHVKPHGALYNDAAVDRRLASAIANAVARFDKELILVGLAGSVLLEAGKAGGLCVAAEGFCDRAYESDGSLRARSLPGAVLDDPQAAARQALDIARDGRARADGQSIQVRAQTLCVHGDTLGAVAIARAVRTALEMAGFEIKRLS